MKYKKNLIKSAKARVTGTIPYCHGKNTAKTRMYMDKLTIYFSNGKQFCWETLDVM
jgi:hypothetical protein